jgi:predicted nucleotidyltransferase
LYNESMDREKLAIILHQLHSGLDTLLGERLDSIYLYGSQARGDAKRDSDIDIMVVLRDDDFRYFDMIKLTSSLTASLSLEYETVISCVFVTKNEFLNRHTPLLINVRRQGIAV